MYYWICAALFMVVLVSSASAEEYYVATDGKAENDGSNENPWLSVEYALSKVGGGNTIIVKPGIYRGPIQIARQYAGTAEAPTIIKSEAKWQAVIIGAPYHVISNGDGCDWVVIDGFEAMGGRYDGIKMNGDYNTVRNCWVHNNKAMGVAMHNQKGGVIENNLIEFNGDHVQFDHGVYADGEDLTICNNIIRHNASFGLHLYPSISSSVIANNLVYGQVRRRGIIVSCPEGSGKNTIVNNTVVEDQGITIWKGDGEVVANNIVVSDNEALLFNESTTNVLIDYNLFVPESDRQGAHGITGDPVFVDAGKGVFWLREGSPAIGRGSAKYAPSVDFWGRDRSESQPTDLGALPFVPFLATEQARDDWDYGWAYHRHGAGIMPDFWKIPSTSGKE
jgi:parallel beta-helix repeat protein